uniref:AAA+ ATPase domain-containing protein n=1 Tax=Eucampia antarctica TaxID=49252 RepID=A0A7S2RGI0_9STRA|mmetsp:Transcript_2193/g.2030  ORF Transcript_2193/g.2030 Transcript_2193/m.2030 type:complete len:362 (+) Transcript_2193:52-1137(+)|eukprot:CAMPEP_0197835800 /NCGR_PEP_ID=MMETSP1437-20131217/26962_1 /TAXON_ID=49252 ORGANISM="Eucampia antarctica, Strain CCMP1452" /NCGR_SAMPLE_ID=MMETSP1437 /ASSEMBLY_ACC=CAM_ASM_001096 /LENGTH=361 /DNA_ID=CAMNT_0043441491 /DNA_START=32 /DNA_END=1117 /DNA_ORIENTATION=+
MAATTSSEGGSTPWVEKYRPKSLDDVSHQTEVVATLQNAVETNRLPHLLLYGPPGTGKTSVALALCRSLWHPSQWKRRVLELNASDERGISIVRNKIKTFASLAVSNNHSKNYFTKQSQDDDNNNSEEKTYPNPPFKVIILDEADTVTLDAQAALRRVIEAYSKVTRFILICNYVTRIIEPLASRCAKFRFKPLPPDSMMARLETISKAEGCDSVNLEEILRLCKGDMRRAVMTLQSAHTLGGSVDIAEMVGLPPPSLISNLVQKLLQQSPFDQMELCVKDLISEGFAVPYIIQSFWEQLAQLPQEQLSDIDKATIAIKIAEADKNLVDGADDFFQFMLVCSTALKCFANTRRTNTQKITN